MHPLGVVRRLHRLQGPGGRIFLLAADHGLPAGPVRGLEDPAALFASIPAPPVTGLLVNPGLARVVPAGSSCGLVVHLSGGTLLGKKPTSKVLVSSVSRALAVGADAVSVQIHFGDADEDRMLSDSGRVVDEADAFGLPVLVMAYPPGATDGVSPLEATRHAARAAAEIGANLVQVPHPGTQDAVRSVVRGCPVPVLVTGGPPVPDSGSFLESVRTAMAGGAAGLSVGRNLFQHPQPAAFAHRIGDALFGRSASIEILGA